MIILNRKIDEAIAIGDRLRVIPTDIDAGSVHLLIKGEQIGGPDDGEAIDRKVELAIGSALRIGTLVNITLMKVETEHNCPARAQFGIQVPPHLIVGKKNADRQPRREGE